METEVGKPKQKTVFIGTDKNGKKAHIRLETINRHLVVVGKSGSGKSYFCRLLFLLLLSLRSVGIIDPNSHLARDILNDVCSVPSLRKRCLYLTITEDNHVPLIDFMQQSTEQASSCQKRRKQLANFFTTAIIMTAGPGGSSAGAGFVRLKMNVEMGVRLLLELKLPMALLPQLFQHGSGILNVLIEKCKDQEVRSHFNQLRSISSASQFYTLVESTVTRLNLFFNSAIVEAMFSQAGSGITIDEILSRERLILICDFGVTKNTYLDHSRMMQKMLHEGMTRSAMNRSDEEAAKYRFSLFVDEAASSGALDLANMEQLAFLRKYGLHLCYLIQGLAGVANRQTEVNLVDALLENTSGRFVFGTASDVDAQRFARLAVPGMDFKDVKHSKVFERQRLVGYESMTRTTRTTSHDGKQSYSVTPVDRPILETETDEQINHYSAEELFHMKAGHLMGQDTGEFHYFGPEYPHGIRLKTEAPKQRTMVSQRMIDRRRNKFLADQLCSFPYRDVDGVRRDFNEILQKYKLPFEQPENDTDRTGPNPFE